MKITFPGSGSAFTMKNFQSNVLIERNGKNLLVDCGTDARFSLEKIGKSSMDIDAVYISHPHADHIGGLEWLAFTTFFNPAVHKPTMFIEGALMLDLWNKSLSGGLECIEGKMVTLRDYFNVVQIESNSYFMWQDIKFEIVQTLHMCAKFKIINSFGLIFTSPDTGKRVFITTDTQFAPTNSMLYCYENSDLIFHDCETMYKSGVHAHYDELKTLDKNFKKKIHLYHYQDNVLDEKCLVSKEWKDTAKADGFGGFVERSQVFTL